MSVSAMGSTGSENFDISLLFRNAASQQGISNIFGAGEGSGSHDFQSSLKLRLAEMQSQTFGMLISSGSERQDRQDSAGFAALFGSDTAGANSLDSLWGDSGLSPTGRNTALFDPESAYRMMTDINKRDVQYKAEFAEMRDMKSYLSMLQQAATEMQGIDAASTNEDIHVRLQAFATQYNDWVQRFDQDLEAGGLLAGTQAARVSQWELEQSVENFFHGAKDGLHGMRDLGLTIDPISNLASIDGNCLDSVLAGNKAGAIGTVQEFSANFARSAELLNSDGNFIPSRLDNLSRVIDYIDNNKQSLQAEFGLGDAAKPKGEVARALASYNAIYGLES